MACGIENGNKDNPTEFGSDVLKMVVVGEPKCGKTTFIRAFARENFAGPETSINGVRVYPCEFDIHDAMRTVNLYEIPSDPRFSIEQRTPHYEKANVVLFMYAVDDPFSFEMLSNRWVPETMSIILANSASVVLLGNKNDLRYNQQVIDRLALKNQIPVTTEQTDGFFPANVRSAVVLEISSLDSDQILHAYSNIPSAFL